MAATLALTAIGLSLVFGVMRVVNVAHGEFFMLGAVLAWFFSTMVTGHPAIGFLLALVLSPLVVGAVAFAAERLVLLTLVVVAVGRVWLFVNVVPLVER